jgi:hypothetical protein
VSSIHNIEIDGLSQVLGSRYRIRSFNKVGPSYLVEVVEGDNVTVYRSIGTDLEQVCADILRQVFSEVNARKGLPRDVSDAMLSLKAFNKALAEIEKEFKRAKVR